MNAKGVDLSHYNQPVDFHTLKASGVAFVALKATEGLSNTDATFADRRQRAHAVGFQKVILYHFLHPTDQAGDEARHFSTVVGELLPGELVAIDVEATPGWDQISSAAGVAKIQNWIAQVKAALGILDNQIVIYGSLGWLKGTFGKYLNQLTHWRLWVAHYEVPSPGDVNPWPDWLIWQNSEHGTVPGAGAAGQVDTDQWNGSVK